MSVNVEYEGVFECSKVGDVEDGRDQGVEERSAYCRVSRLGMEGEWVLSYVLRVLLLVLFLKF